MVSPQSDSRTEIGEFRMTDLEERLASEGGVELKLEILAALSAKGKMIRDLLEVGVTPSEFAKARHVYNGLAAAHEIIKKFPARGRKKL